MQFTKKKRHLKKNMIIYSLDVKQCSQWYIHKHMRKTIEEKAKSLYQGKGSQRVKCVICFYSI